MPDPSRRRHQVLEEQSRKAQPGFGAAALDNPVAAGGWLVMLLTGFLIIANATLFQKAPHPSPFFTTRDRPAAETVAPVVATPTAADLERQKLVRDVQIELRRLGLYEGTLDGLNGPATERGVRGYQRSRGVPETGLINTALLARLAMDTPQPTQTIAIPPVSPRARQSETTSVQGTSVAPPASVDPLSTRVGRVQTALAELGYGPLDIDGVMGEQTANAIRRFELDRGMAISGIADADLERAIERVLGRPIRP